MQNGKSKDIVDRFHRVKSVIPNDQKLEMVAPGTKVREAIQILLEKGYSTLPVIDGSILLGSFSFQSFASRALELPEAGSRLLELPVEEFLEQLPLVQEDHELHDLFDALDRHDAVLIGSRHDLRNLASPMDVLRYYYNVASPFVMVGEIELALRGLLRQSVSSQELEECTRRALGHLYEDRPLPALEEMSLDNYVQILAHGENWKLFQSAFRGDRNETQKRLKRARKLRKDLFHFRRELTGEDRTFLQKIRDWLLVRALVAEGGHREG